MAKCTVTLNVAKLGVAYSSDSMGVAPAAARDDGTYWVTGEMVHVPLANSPLSTVDVDQGQVYAYVTPDGETDYRLTPAESAKDFTDLEIVSWIPATGGILGDSVVDDVLSNPSSDSYATLLAFIEDHPGPAGPGNTDAGTADFVNNGTETKTALGDEASDDTSPLSMAITELIASGTSGKQDAASLPALLGTEADDDDSPLAVAVDARIGAGIESKQDTATLEDDVTDFADELYLPSQTHSAVSKVVDRPSGILEGRFLFQYGPSRGVTGNAARIHFDRIRARTSSATAANQSVPGFLASDTATRMYGSIVGTVQGSAADASITSSGAGTWSNRAMWSGVLIMWPFGNDALFDGASSHNSTTAKARASAANALHAAICMARAEQRVESYSVFTVGVTNGSPVVTLAGGANKYYKGMLVTGTGVPANTYVGTVSSTGFRLSSSRTSQVDVNFTGTTNAALSISMSTVRSGSWTVHQAATAPDTSFSGNSYQLAATNGLTSTYQLHLDESRKVQWVTAAIDDPEYTALSGAAGSSYSISVDGGTAITGTTSNEHRITNIGGGLQLGLGYGPKAVDLGTLAAGDHTIVVTNSGTTGKWLFDDCLLIESLTPLTILLMKEVELPAAYYALAVAVANGASYAKTQIYNAIIDAEVALWPSDDSVITRAIDADSVNGTYDKAVHISSFDGTYAHFNDLGERLVTDKIMGWLNALSARAGFTKG